VVGVDDSFLQLAIDNTTKEEMIAIVLNLDFIFNLLYYKDS
jgi:hypothetical protein